MECIKVQLKENSYDVIIGRGLLQEIQKVEQALQYKHRKAVIITDAIVAKKQKAFLDSLFREFPRFIIPSGEENKSFNILGKIYEFLIDKKIDRASAIFAVGGGVVGDVVGFAAATYMRGVDYYQIPTTLTALVDSSIGGKTTINFKGVKNIVGAFHQPKMVFADLNCLETLPQREFSSGMAEIIKYGLLADPSLFEKLEQEGVLTASCPELENIVRRCCAIKSNIVAEDERDIYGKRSLLNLGHTFAHAIEKVAGYTKYTHGEAVAIGLVIAGALSMLLGFIRKNDLIRIECMIQRYGLPIDFEEPLNMNELIDSMRLDKKSISDELNFVILKKIGEAAIYKNVEEKWIRHVLIEVGAKE